MDKNTVSIVRIEEDQVEKAVRKALDLIGGIEAIVNPGEKVLLKVNWCVVPEDPKVGVVTNPVVARAVADLIKEAGAEPIIGDSAARGVDTDLVIKATGYGKLADEGYQIANLDKEKVIKLECPGSELLHTMKTFELATKVDKIIDIPLFKTHDSAEATLGLKNMKGLLHDDQKSKLHREGLYTGIADVNLRFPPDLVVYDGTWAMEGLGPMYGIPFELNLILAARNVVAGDAVAGNIMGFEPAELIVTKIAYERGLGEMNLDKIAILGAPLESVKRRFKRVEEDDRIIYPNVQIVHSEGTCTGCKVAIMSSLFDMKNKGILDQAEGFTFTTGDVELPYGIPQEKVVSVGICVPKEKRGTRWSKGCPPNNVYTIEAVTGQESKDSYSTD
ncbi:MAG: DUF362 domain-containing protein [Desulfobacterales bacterium]|nr:DUF362 domain-containing protein [Desulfobacterales bacterium]MDH4010016.1 DUF362 domain-containing protein [Desulfobacterales bacterium]